MPTGVSLCCFLLPQPRRMAKRHCEGGRKWQAVTKQREPTDENIAAVAGSLEVETCVGGCVSCLVFTSLCTNWYHHRAPLHWSLPHAPSTG